MAAPVGGSATRLGVTGDQFTINDQATFLLGVSYYHGRGWKLSDLDALQARGINLIRIFLENWEQATRAFVDADGNLTDAQSLLDLVRAADARGIVVDVTILDWESKPLSNNPQAAVRNVVRALKDQRNVIFDLVNEHNWGSGIYASHELIKVLRDVAKQEMPAAIVTASSCCGHVMDDLALNAAELQAEVNISQLDVIAPHFLRDALWYDKVDQRVALVRNYLAATGAVRPVYLQEEHRRRFPDPSSPTKDQFWQAAREARVAGAAGYVFHTDAGFNLDGSRTFFGNLDAEELATLDRIAAQSRGESAQASAGAGSGGVTMPPSTSLSTSDGAVWGLGTKTGIQYAMTRNGQQVADSVDYLLLRDGTVYVSDVGQCWRYDAGNWAEVAAALCQ